MEIIIWGIDAKPSIQVLLLTSNIIITANIKQLRASHFAKHHKGIKFLKTILGEILLTLFYNWRNQSLKK